MASASKTKGTGNSKQDLQKKRAAIEVAFKKKEDSERRALKIVEHIVESLTVDIQWLTDNAKFLNPSYYQDAVEERALNKQCGFPLCPKLIEKVWKQKYTIDLSSKKVFDVTLRKNFCSDVCFSSSNNFKDQLLTSPLWTRKEEMNLCFHIEYPVTNKGLRGDEVLLTSVVLPEDCDIIENELGIIEEKKFEKSKSPKKLEHAISVPNPVDRVFEVIRHWWTTKSVDWIKQHGDLDGQITSIEEKISEINMNRSNRKEEKLKDRSKCLKSTLDANEMKKNERLNQLQVHAFLLGQTEYNIEDEFDDLIAKDDVKSVEENLEGAIPVVMPLKNFSAQKILRKKIVMDYVANWFSCKTVISGLKFRTCERELDELVSTFHFTADTITFRPKEVPILCLILIKVLSIKNASVRETLTHSSIQGEVAKFLIPYQLDYDVIENFVNHLTS